MTAIDVADVLRHADDLAGRGRWDEALAVLTDHNRRSPSGDVEARLVDVRHRAFADLDTAPRPAPAPVPDRFDGVEGLPEIAAAELSAPAIASALQHHGALLVRGLVDEAVAAEMRTLIDRAFDGAAEAARALAEHRALAGLDTAPWFVPFEPAEGYEFGPIERAFATHGGGVLAVDAPRALFTLIEAYEAAGVREVFAEYFGERPVISVKKSTLRRTEPDALAGWHQDGAFLGRHTHALNIWTAMSPCGVDAAGLDLFARGFDEIVPTGGPDIFDWSVHDDTAAGLGLEAVVRPTFGTGDAVIFDHMTLHRTGVDATMTQTRYAVEMWFFGPSTYPHEQIPVVF